MSQLCKVCTLPPTRRAKIDAAIAAGTAYHRIARKFSTKSLLINAMNLSRHRAHIVPKELVRTVRKAPAPPPDVGLSLLQRVENLVGELRSISGRAKFEQTEVACVREIRSCLTLLAQLSGELTGSGTTVNLNNINLDTMNEQFIENLLKAVARSHDEGFKSRVQKMSYHILPLASEQEAEIDAILKAAIGPHRCTACGYVGEFLPVEPANQQPLLDGMDKDLNDALNSMKDPVTNLLKRPDNV